jgi:hypothetical protein
MGQFTVAEDTRVYPDPDTNSQALGTISPGDQITVAFRLGDWAKITVISDQHDIDSGWLPAEDLDEVVGQTVRLHPEPFAEEFQLVTGTIDTLAELVNWRKVQVTSGDVQHSGWIDVNVTPAEQEPVSTPGPSVGTTLDLGVNEIYRESLLRAQKITGIDAAALAALIDAEASKIRSGPNKGQWNPRATSRSSSAAGLTQFLSGTWLEHARRSGTLLNQVATDRGFVTSLNAVAAGKRDALLGLRFDPELSIVSAAEYGFANLNALDRAGFIPDDATDDYKARMMYLAHHEGLTGAKRFLTQTNPPSLEKFASQVGRERAVTMTEAVGGDVALAYRNWFNGYIDEKIQPDRFRKAGPGPVIIVAGSSALAKLTGAPIPMSLLGSDQHKELVIEAQKALDEFGYLDPPADGKWGAVSNWALEEFCTRHGLALTDGFTPDVAQALLNPSKPLPDIAPRHDWFDKVLSYMNQKGYWISRHPACTNIVYLEGVNPDGTLNDDRPNVFNDLRVIFTIDDAGRPQLECWEATTEPGTHWTIQPMNENGAARIAFDQYQAWQVGWHNWRKQPPSKHEALVQVEPVAVHRDLNKDFKRTNDRIYTGLFGINQHWGYDAPKNDLGTTSAGCQVGRTKSGHREFMRLVKGDARYQARSSYKFLTAILPGDEVLG